MNGSSNSFWRRLCSAGEDTAQPVGRLAVQNNQIVNESGRPVVLRGISLFWSQWQPVFFSADTLRWLKEDWKISVIRAPLGVHNDGYLANPTAERRKIEAVIEAAIELGLYVVVDWHAHDPETEHACDFFSGVARDYGRYPNIIYETWNEPSGTYAWHSIKQHHSAVIDRIRSWDVHNLVIAGTQNWCRDVDTAANDPLPFENTAYSLHFYAASHGQELRDKAERALKMGAALMATEWGTCEDNGGGRLAHREVKRWLDFLEDHRISHMNWSLSNRNETSAILNQDTEAPRGWVESELSASGRLIRDILRNSARPRSLGGKILNAL